MATPQYPEWIQIISIPSAEQQLLCCELCQFGLSVKTLVYHIHERHGIPLKDARRISYILNEEYDLIQNNSDVNIDMMVDQLVEPIKELRIHKGYICNIDPTFCRYSARSLNTMRHHRKDEHSETTLHPGQRYGNEKIKSFTENVLCQRLFNNGANSSYFPILSTINIKRSKKLRISQSQSQPQKPESSQKRSFQHSPSSSINPKNPKNRNVQNNQDIQVNN